MDHFAEKQQDTKKFVELLHEYVVAIIEDHNHPEGRFSEKLNAEHELLRFLLND